jgi:hypothetical protein
VIPARANASMTASVFPTDVAGRIAAASRSTAPGSSTGAGNAG